MDVQQFLAEFGHIANAKVGVARLRQLVLHLAVSGYLTDQRAGEDAEEFFREIQATQKGLLADGVVRVNRKIRSGRESGKWQIPKSWIWCRLGELCSFSAGRTPSRKEEKFWNTGDYPWFSIADLKSGKTVSASRESISEIARSEIFKSAPSPAGSLLMSFKLSIGKISLLGVPAYHNEAIITIEPFSPLLKEFFFRCLNGFDLTAGNKAAIKGSTLNQDSISNILVALPPKGEIPRIVAKVNELMALCDQLEQNQQDRRKLQNALRQSTLQAVASAQSPHELQDSWKQLEAIYGHLFNEPKDVDDLIAELKNLAVRGLLAEAPTAPPEIERIKSDCTNLRQQYLDASLMRRQKLVGMAEYDTTYPEHWGVVAFDEVAVVIGGVTKGRDIRSKETIICPYLAVANVQRGYFNLDSLKSIEILKSEEPKYVVQEGDLLITEGGDWDKVGRTAIWQGGIANCLHQNHVFKARVPSPLLKNEWVELVLNSGVGRDYFAGASKQTTNLASINMTQLRSFPLPVPSLDEQEHALAALSMLIGQCTEWRQQLEQKQVLSALLTNAVVAELTGVNIEPEEETLVKAPQTELIAPLRLGTPPDVKAQAPLATILARHNGAMSARDLWQRFGGEIDAFYAQLKTEVAHSWIATPEVAEMREKPAKATRA